MKFTPADLDKLIALVDITSVDEIDCGEFLHRVAGYIERLGPAGEPPEGYEQVIAHLRLCPECLEEFEAMYRSLRQDD